MPTETTARKSAPIPVRFDPDDAAAIRALAEQDGRTVSGYVRHVMRQHIAEQAS